MKNMRELLDKKITEPTEALATYLVNRGIDGDRIAALLGIVCHRCSVEPDPSEVFADMMVLLYENESVSDEELEGLAADYINALFRCKSLVAGTISTLYN